MTHFYMGKKPFENTVGKGELLVQAISPFPSVFSTLSKTEIIIFVTFNLSSANAFSFGLVQNFVVWEWVKENCWIHFVSVIRLVFLQYAMESQIQLRGYDPETAIVLVEPRPVSMPFILFLQNKYYHGYN